MTNTPDGISSWLYEMIDQHILQFILSSWKEKEQNFADLLGLENDFSFPEQFDLLQTKLTHPTNSFFKAWQVGANVCEVW